MRRNTPKRAARDAKALPVREAMKLLVGRCEWCRAERAGLEMHEILRGNGLRVKAQDEPCATLILCPPCHELMDGRPLDEQLAILRRCRPEDYDLRKFHELASRRHPDDEAVAMWLKRYWVLRS